MEGKNYLELIKISVEQIAKLNAEKELIDKKIKLFNLTIESCVEKIQSNEVEK